MKKSVFFLSIIAAAVMTSCGGAIPPEMLQVNPNPLTVVGNKVNVELTGNFPEKQFGKKAVVVVTPVLKYEGGEALAEPVTYVGEKVKENGEVIGYKLGGKYVQSASFDYIPAMDKCELYLRLDATLGDKKIDIEDIKVADGLVATAKLATAEDNNTVLTADKFQRIIQEVQEADIKFMIQQANLRTSETKSEAVKNIQAAIKDANDDERKAINNLEVSGYASPDGGLKLNDKLAAQRQKNAQQFLAKQMKKDKVNAEIAANVTAQDWDGFQAAMENSNIQDKELVLRVLSMYQDPEERENQIKNLSAVYKKLADDVLPALRRSRIILTTDLIGKSDEEIVACWNNNAAELNVEEMLYCATLVDDKMAIYQKAAELYNDYRAYNNMGKLYFEQGNLEEASRCYAKALEIEPNNADVNYNAGLCAMAQGDLTKAEACLGKAAGTEGNLNAAMGTLYTMKGDYAAAAKSYGSVASNNAAVQQILNEDYAAARKTLDAVANPNATTAYLKAVVAARTNDRDAVYSNMTEAVAKNATLKAKAQKDIEFANFAEDEQFQAIIK